jgi:hypothetical protein
MRKYFIGLHALPYLRIEALSYQQSSFKIKSSCSLQEGNLIVFNFIIIKKTTNQVSAEKDFN